MTTRETAMVTRRKFLALGAAGTVAGAFGGTIAGPALFGSAARAADRPLTFCSWGGALSDLEKTCFIEPFAKSKGIEAAYASPTAYAKIKSMVEAGYPEWDLVDVGGRFIFDGEALIEPLDMSLIPNAKNLDPGWVTPKGIFTSTGATVIAWNTAAFPAARGRPRGRISGTSKNSPARAASTRRSITTTRRRCSPPERRGARSIPSPTRRRRLPSPNCARSSPR
jgi:putative spermidine/putrescine transport system substrate-binding protein